MTRVVEPSGAALDGGIIRAVKRQLIEAHRLLRVLSYGHTSIEKMASFMSVPNSRYRQSTAP